MTNFSQRDWRWSWKKLGGSTVTIGGYGCCMSCCGMVVDKNPDETNKIMIEHGAFADSPPLKKVLVDWTKLACIGLKLIWRSKVYDNTKVLAAIKKHGFCLVEVNATPIGSPRTKHWLVFIGDKKCVDPWDGKTKSTSVYAGANGKGLLGYCELAKI